MPSFNTITFSFSCIKSMRFLFSSESLIKKSSLTLSYIKRAIKRVSGIIKMNLKKVSMVKTEIEAIKYFMVI